MALFKSRDVKEAEAIIKSVIQSSDLECTSRSFFENHTENDYVCFSCSEEDFGPGLKRCLGYGDYYGNVNIMYTPKTGWLVADIYYGKVTRSVAQIKANAESAREYLNFNYEVYTTDPRHPNVYISKNVTMDRLRNEVDNLFVMIGLIID
ncbi:MAG: hypothetical protein IJW26_00435 [Clostridia bacterium]|nr:hypothetical protein [Clostridia bacterium]